LSVQQKDRKTTISATDEGTIGYASHTLQGVVHSCTSYVIKKCV